MPSSHSMICFTCGQETSAGPRMNYLNDGRPCPACRERLLDALAPALPSQGEAKDAPAVESLADISDEIDLDGDAPEPPQPA